MNHCLIITAYKDVENLNRLISRCPENWGIYVHLDKKSRISTSDVNQRAKVFRWYRIYWGAYEHILAIFRMIQCARNDADWDFYHIISGQDYFASDPTEFDSICERGKNYITIVNSLPNIDWCWDCGEGLLFKYKHLSSVCDVRGPIASRLNRQYVNLQKRLSLQCPVPNYSTFFGIVWCSINNNFVNWLLNDSLTKDLLKRLRGTLVGEEVFFQTLIMNSPYRESIAENNLHYQNWQDGPKVLLEEDYDDIVSNDYKYLFCRKVDSDISAGLIAMLSRKN